MSNTTALMGQRPNQDGTCPFGLYLPCMYNNKLSYICNPFGDTNKNIACSRTDTTVECPILSGGEPATCSIIKQQSPSSTTSQPEEPIQAPSEQSTAYQPPVQPEEQPPPVQPEETTSGIVNNTIKYGFFVYILNIILIISSLVVIYCYSKLYPKNKVMSGVNVSTLILQIIALLILIFM